MELYVKIILFVFVASVQQISQSEAADEPDRHEEDTTTEGTDREDISGNCLKWLMQYHAMLILLNQSLLFLA